ncbi:Multidrug resistance-associated protein 1 [Clonorchis sinensis]|uniref:ABC-type glutathione-S-conjugate transporter n=1 Tax=Clonorchis sinensis TaxID=79923 RepID=A0A8T1M2Y0_CLOSI|nr:Multidrug resistance-associated protein 1 [Clonorchis sinensis]
MTQLRREMCNDTLREWVEVWNRPIPYIPQCQILFIVPCLYLFYGTFMCIPYATHLLLKKQKTSRPVSRILIAESVVLFILYWNNISQIVCELAGERPLYDQTLYSSSLLYILLLQLLVWHVERKRDAPNSSVSFFLLLFCTLGTAARCWNHLSVVLDQTTTSNELSNISIAVTPNRASLQSFAVADWQADAIKITDMIDLCGLILLLILSTNSERMIQYKKLIKKISPLQHTSKVTGGRTHLCRKAKEIDAKLSSELDTTLGSEKCVAEVQSNTSEKPDEPKFPSPEEHASFLSRTLFTWFTSLIIRGYRKPLELIDLWKLDEKHCAQHVSDKFFRNLDALLIPKRTVNYYMERRRISSLNGYTENINCSSSRLNTLDDRRQSTQSADVISDQPALPPSSNNRRASDGAALQRSFRSKERLSSTFAKSIPDMMCDVPISRPPNKSGQLSPQLEEEGSGSLYNRESVSTPDGIANQFRAHDSRQNGTVPVNQGIDTVVPGVCIVGPQRHSSTRRSVRIRVGTKPAFVPGQSESRSDSVVTQTAEEMNVDKQPIDCNLSRSSLGSLNLGKSKKENTTSGSQTRAKKSRDLSSTTQANKRSSEVDSTKSEHHHKCFCLCRFLRCCTGSGWSLMNSIMLTYWKPLLWTGFMKLIYDTLLFVNPLLLKFLLNFMQRKEAEPVWHGYCYAFSMFVVAGVQTLVLQSYFREVNIIGMHLRTALTCAVYRKSLRLSNRARQESTTGQIMNIISSDVQQFVQLMPYLHVAWSGPFQIAVAITFLWYELGLAVLAGIGVLLLLLPLNALMARLSKKVQEKKYRVADSRIKMITEVLNGIRVIKLYAWEPSFADEVSRLRGEEMRYLRKFTYVQSLAFLWNCVPFFVGLSSFGVYIFLSEGGVLDAQKAFVSTSLFNILRFPLFMFPMVTSNLVQTYVSLRRIGRFLRRTEVDPNSCSHEDTPGVAAVIERGVFGWDPEGEPILQNISVQFPEGQLTSIMGKVGCGKSSLLQALLGEMELFNGRVNVKGSVAYVPQQPWIFNATLRDNILFHKPYNPVRYAKVIQACSLVPDLEILPNGDLTEIGDKGINLSGGQKQRVSLARACYADADIYLLDDPLSAVDAHVGLHILNEVLSRSKGLLSTKTCILTTHSSKALAFSDRVGLLSDGQVVELGTYRQLVRSRRSRLNEFLSSTSNQDPETNDTQITTEDAPQKPGQANSNALAHSRGQTGRATRSLDQSNTTGRQTVSTNPDGVRDRRHSSGCSMSSSVESLLTSVRQSERQPSLASSIELPTYDLLDLPATMDPDEDENQNASVNRDRVPEKVDKLNKAQIIQPEQARTGRVKWSVFKIYLRNVGLLYSLLILVSFPLSQLASFGTSLWLADWSEDAATQVNLTEFLKANPDALRNTSAYPGLDQQLTEYYAQRDYRLGIYGALGLAQVVASWVSVIAFASGHLACAQKLHDLLLAGVLHAPGGFFDSVPQGRIVNRFSADIATLDHPLLNSMRSCFSCMLQCLTTVLLTTSVSPWIIIPMACLTAVYCFLQNVYVTNSRQLKRIESVYRSPIFSHFSETLLGADNIRAYGRTEDYNKINSSRLDTGNAASYFNMIAQRWLAVLLETIGNLIIFSVAVFSVITRDHLSAGLSGLVISYAINLNQTLNWFVRMTADLENDIVCVERINEYANIEQEAEWEIPDRKPSASWPAGRVEFINYSTRYRSDLDLVLNSVNLTINPGERVGIAGRTGSGKSSLVMGLFRMLEAAEGRIIIDGIDIAEIGLHDLRQRLTLIPQDPVLFSGTLRFNLDPFKTHTDAELWNALEHANLKPFVVEASGGLGLDMIISEGGANISLGQRQLVCLARALLRRTPILVLDEATAAVDPVTDSLIQKTIRTEFAHCTVLTIAHRLNTIMDYNRVLILQEGKIIEIGDPRVLLRDSTSKFYSLAKDAHLVG